jgi:hypothetical protein
MASVLIRAVRKLIRSTPLKGKVDGIMMEEIEKAFEGMGLEQGQV